MMRYLLAAMLGLLAVQAPAEDREVAGVRLPATVQVPGLETPLRLNGAGVRRKFFFRIYVAALYLPQPQHDAAAILDAAPPWRMLMHFLYDEVSKEKLAAAWEEGFRANLDAKAYRAVAGRLQDLIALFPTLREGDEVLLDHLPGRGVRVVIGGEEQGLIPGDDFATALLSVWLGPEPVTESLKKALLAADRSP